MSLPSANSMQGPPRRLSAPPTRSPARPGSSPRTRVNPFLVSPSLESSCIRERLSLRSFSHDFFDFKEIGSGCFGKVFSCTRKLDLCNYAVKEIQCEARNERERERLLKEIYALASQAKRDFLGHAHDASTLLDVLAQIAAGLAHMHKTNVAHLDVKPENMYTTQTGVYKLGDLGLASLASSGTAEDEGDKRYLSREMLQADSCDLYKADIFALGASIYELASEGPLPLEGDAYHALRDGSAPMPPVLSPDAQALLRAMLHPDPAVRPSACQILEHPLLVGRMREEALAGLRGAVPGGGGRDYVAAYAQDVDPEKVEKMHKGALRADQENARLKKQLADATKQLEAVQRALMLLSGPQASAEHPAPQTASARLNSIWDDNAKPPAASAAPGALPNNIFSVNLSRNAPSGNGGVPISSAKPDTPSWRFGEAAGAAQAELATRRASSAEHSASRVSSHPVLLPS
ncbi:kinase-like domain-containing protein [Baffinella frigidus]|nr:kinase-like domain-containing protein [Cryptophyta sp. CCMP2293]